MNLKDMAAAVTNGPPLRKVRKTRRAHFCVLTRQAFYDALPKDANDEQYALADRIYEHVAALATEGE